jgi:hypothetical protein
MSNCVRNCRLCRSIVISTAVTLVTIDGVDTLVIDIPVGCYCDNARVCLIVAQTIPATTPITAPVAISIGGDTTTVFPILTCDCTQVTACAIRTRTKYGLRINTSATSAVFKTLKPLACYPQATLEAIPTPSPAAATVLSARTTTVKAPTKTTAKEA